MNLLRVRVKIVFLFVDTLFKHMVKTGELLSCYNTADDFEKQNAAENEKSKILTTNLFPPSGSRAVHFSNFFKNIGDKCSFTASSLTIFPKTSSLDFISFLLPYFPNSFPLLIFFFFDGEALPSLADLVGEARALSLLFWGFTADETEFFWRPSPLAAFTTFGVESFPTSFNFLKDKKKQAHIFS